MEHPLRSDDHKSLRRRLYDLISNGLTVPRQSNIVFVCGGNEPHHMRRRFQAEFSSLLPKHEFFEPEFAMRTYWTLGDSEPFDISSFEELICDLSHSIVIFPEAPGSLAETGYFSAIPKIAKRILLVINSEHLRSDSFISIGPAKKIADVSIFQPNIQFDYSNPEFAIISRRLIDRAPLFTTRKSLKIDLFSEMSSFDIFSLVQFMVSFLRIATVDDIEFFARGLFDAHISTSKTKQIVSILVGSRRLVQIGEFGHLKVNDGKNLILQVKDGAKTGFDVLKVDLSTVYLGADPDFISLMGS